MCKPSYIFLIFSVFTTLLTGIQRLNAQETGTLRGFVTDSTNGEALAFSNIYIKELNRGTVTNSSGYYIITSIPTDRTYSVVASYMGYTSVTKTVLVQKDKSALLNFQLNHNIVQLPVVETIGNRSIEENATKISLERFTLRQLENMPHGVETDIFRALQTVPGVQSTGDVSAKYYVRGSPDDENLILIDGADLYGPFHALGLFGVVDPDIINNIEFYEGGFPAEYGGRMSSVLRIITKNGNKNSFDANTSAGFLTAKALAEGPVPNGSFIISGRKSISDEILKKFLNNKTVPLDFYDMSFKINESLTNGSLTIHGLYTGDKINNTGLLGSNYALTNKIIGLRYFHVSESPLFYEINIYESYFEGDITPNNTMVRPETNSIDDYTIKGDFTYVYQSKDEIKAGLEVKDIQNHLLLRNSYGAESDLGSHGFTMGVYAKYKLLRFQSVSLDAGTRLTYRKATDAASGLVNLEPRINVAYNIEPDLSLHGAFGLYKQILTSLSDEDQVISLFEPWLLIPSYLSLPGEYHYILGVKWLPNPGLSIGAEAYYKLTEYLPVLNDKKYFSSDPDFIEGSGKSYGMDLSAKYNISNINLNASYSLSWAFKEANGIIYPPAYDIRHSVTLSIGYNLGGGWHASAQWFFHTGLPFTQIAGYYSKYYYNDQPDYWSIYYSYYPFTILGARNSYRLPTYHRLDISLRKTFVIYKSRLTFDANILNAYNRANFFYYDQSTGRRVNMLPFLPSITIKLQI